MPNWKRVIVSGSDATLTSVTATAGFTGSLQGTASYATNALSASYAPSAAGATFPYTGSALITGSLGVTGTFNQASASLATGLFAHAQGLSVTASGAYSHAEGYFTTATGDYSHAEGQGTQATNYGSHAEGYSTIASGYASHAEGYGTQATNDGSHAEGQGTIASGYYSHAEGQYTTASGYYSHAEGHYTIASGFYQHVQGQYNISSSAQSAFIVGNGTGVGALRSNLIFASGFQVQVTGSIIATSGFTGSLQGTASFATQALSASYAPSTPAFPYTGSAGITGSLTVVGPTTSTQIGAGAAPTVSVPLDVRAQGALSTDLALRVRNSANSSNIITVAGDGGVTHVGRYGLNVAPNAAIDFYLSGVGSTYGFHAGGSYGYAAIISTPNTTATRHNFYAPSVGFGGAYKAENTGGSATVTGTRIGFATSDFNANTYDNIAFQASISNTGGGLAIAVDSTDNAHFRFGTISGSKLGTSTTQKIGFWNATPIVQPTASTAIDTLLTNTGLRATGGNANFATPITASRAFISSSNGTVSGSSLTVYGSGSAQPVFTVQGSQGELFSITDSLSGSLFSVNDISGLPIMEVFSDNTILMGSYLAPSLNTTAKVVQTNSGSFTMYSLPTASYDTAFFEYSVRSGSNARAGTIMAIQSGSAVNFTETTTTDFGSTSAVSFTVIVTGSNMALTGSSTSGAWTIKTIVRSI